MINKKVIKILKSSLVFFMYLLQNFSGYSIYKIPGFQFSLLILLITICLTKRELNQKSTYFMYLNNDTIKY